MNVAIVGGGEACRNLLKLLDDERLARLQMTIVGVSDPDPEGPGIRLAREMDLFTATDFHTLYDLDVNMILEMTGREEVRKEIERSKPTGISLMDHRAVRLLWDLIQMEMERTEFERERQRYQEKSREDIQAILDSLPYRLMVVNGDKTVSAANRTLLKEYGLSAEEAIGAPCYKVRYGLDHPCDQAGRECFLETRLEELHRDGLVSTFQEVSHPDGWESYDVVTISPIFNEQGEIKQILEASRDVTQRVRLEREVERNKTLFQNVIESTVDGIVMVDTKGNVLIFNEGMEQLTRYSAEEIINRGHLSTFYDIETAKENMRKMRSEDHGPPGKLNPTSMSIVTRDGEEIPVTLSASIITIDGEEVGSVGVFRDMREILEMRRELEDTHLQLVQSEKVASVGRMAAGVAHEINNPLAGILMYAEILKENIKDDNQSLEDIQEIIDQTLRCKDIVAELLEFSRRSVGKVSTFSLEDLIRKSLNLLVDQALFQDIDVRVHVEPDLPSVAGDLGQLQQVLTNLFINAADAMEGKGELEVRGRYDHLKNRFEVTVSDTGPGIPEAFLDKIFEIFFTTKPVGRGTGLGLSISKKIIELHGGSLSVASPPGGGTTFTIKLPLGFLEDTDGESDVFVQ
ncbi:MAG: PAS domain S-box protein [Deltaproteobacteria bacterium]|nr:PAS domain S-box protein [Deltaproteobacteria bacterium]